MLLAALLQLVIDGMPQDWEQCEAQPHLPWCVAECQLDDWGSWCEPEITLEEAASVDARARELIRLREDRADKWHSLASEVQAGRRYSGDCDDLVSTVLDLWAQSGARPSQLGRIVVVNPQPEEGGDPEHMVATLEVEGILYVGGDTYGEMRPWSDVDYAPLWITTADMGLKWKRAGNQNDPR